MNGEEGRVNGDNCALPVDGDAVGGREWIDINLNKDTGGVILKLEVIESSKIASMYEKSTVGGDVGLGGSVKTRSAITGNDRGGREAELAFTVGQTNGNSKSST